ncbi:MAG TPA: Bilin biosynthesis protein PecF [Cyanobacteria bacterium UBA8543]|nr:Bilin biosynthesis protein PecF [Cyanobacteria bacterium UBA8543]
MHTFQSNDTDSFSNLDTTELINQLHKAVTPTETVTVIQALAARRTNEAIAPLIQIFHHHNPVVLAAVVEALVQLAPNTVEPLITAFQASKDHGMQAFIVQALARIGDARALDLLIEVVGVEVANHCQGNVRRVAARGLGKIGRTSDSQTRYRAVERLTWALFNAADWALRYAAVVSLQEIATAEALVALQQALTQELDNVVQLRIKTALES